MHEHGIARDLWKTVLENTANSGINKITKITVVLGEASGIEKDFLDHSFKDHIFLENEIAKGAQIEYETVPLSAVCNVCGKTISVEDMNSLICPFCKANNISVNSGRDVYIKSVEGE